MSHDGRPYDRRLKSALKKYRLAQRLKDPRKLIGALRYYNANLKPGQWVELKPPCRERSRALNRSWDTALRAARRILHMAVRLRWDIQTSKPVLSYYIASPVWHFVTSRLGVSAPASGRHGNSRRDKQQPGTLRDLVHEHQAQTQRRLSLNTETPEERKRRLEAERFETALRSEEIAQAFHDLPPGWKMTKELEALTSELGPLLLERAKAYLSRDYERLVPPSALMRQEPERTPAQTQPQPEKVTVADFAKRFLDKIARG